MIPLRGGGGGWGTTTSGCCGWRGGALGNGLPIPGRDLVAASDAAVGWMEQRHAWGGRGVVQGLTAGIGKAVTHHRTPHTPTMPPPGSPRAFTPASWGGGGRRLARYRRVMVSGHSKRRCRRHLLSSATDACSTRVCPGGLCVCVCALSLLFARREGVEKAGARLGGWGRACGGGRTGHEGAEVDESCSEGRPRAGGGRGGCPPSSPGGLLVRVCWRAAGGRNRGGTPIPRLADSGSDSPLGPDCDRLPAACVWIG